MVITMANYALLTPPRVAHAKPPGPKIVTILKSWWTGLDFTFSHDYSIFQWFGRDKSFESSRNFSISTTPPLTCFIITITTLARICLPHPSSSSHPPPEHVWSKKLCRAVPHPLPPSICHFVFSAGWCHSFLLFAVGGCWEGLGNTLAQRFTNGLVLMLCARAKPFNVTCYPWIRPGILLKPSTSKNSGGESFHKNSVCSDHKKWWKNAWFSDYLRSTRYLTTATTNIVT